MIMKWEINATNWRNVAADDQHISFSILKDSPAAMPAVAKTWFALRYGNFSNPTLTEDKLSTAHQIG